MGIKKKVIEVLFILVAITSIVYVNRSSFESPVYKDIEISVTINKIAMVDDVGIKLNVKIDDTVRETNQISQSEIELILLSGEIDNIRNYNPGMPINISCIQKDSKIIRDTCREIFGGANE